MIKKIFLGIIPAILGLPHMKSSPKVYYSWFFPVYFRGIMIPYIGILIHFKHKTDVPLILHENIHWQQFQRMGLFVFLFRYLFQLIFIGYDTMPMEMEARQHLPEQLKWNYRIAFLNERT